MSTTLISKTQEQNELGKVLTNSYFLDKKNISEASIGWI